jgi:hypothetical protein
MEEATIAKLEQLYDKCSRRPIIKSVDPRYIGVISPSSDASPSCNANSAA